MNTDKQIQSNNPTNKTKSLWSTFKNAYLRNRNLKSFWNNLDKKNIPADFVIVMNLFINSKSYNWTSKFWRHLAINHLTLISSQNYTNFENIILKEYFTFTFFNESMVEEPSEKVKKKY